MVTSVGIEVLKQEMAKFEWLIPNLKEMGIFFEVKDETIEIPLVDKQPVTADAIRKIIEDAAVKAGIIVVMNEEPRQGVPPFVVRVAGFSAYFQDMNVEIQDQIIARTKQRL